MAKQYSYEFPRPSVTVDIVLVTREAQPRVLLIRRKHPPYAGDWAIPGGFIEMQETLEESVRGELREETGLEVAKLKQLGAFGDPDRDPRGRTISVAFLGRIDTSQMGDAHAADDAAEVGWYSLAELPHLAFDHAKILQLAKRRLKVK